MPSPIEQALISLIPTLNVLPQELIQLATSLLAQSRSKAASLKADEEIARTYACANLAADRLKVRLGIEKITPRPPVPPRIYKKLYSHLDASLKTATTPRTPRHRDGLVASAQGTPTSTRSRGGVATPVQTQAQIVGSATRSSTRRATHAPPKTTGRSSLGTPVLSRSLTDSNTDDAPGVPPAASRIAGALCDMLDLRAAEEHILAGCQAVLIHRGWTPITTSMRRLSSTSPESIRKRGRPTAASARDTESPRKRRRTGLHAATVIEDSEAEREDAEKPASMDRRITPDTLPSLVVALGTFVLSLFRGVKFDSGEAYEAFRLQLVRTARGVPEGLTGTATEAEMDARVQEFVESAQGESWTDGSWVAGARAAAAEETKARGRAQLEAEADLDVDMDVEMQDAQYEGADDDVETDAAARLQRTPKKNKRPAKTPLRRKEKHARPEDFDAALPGRGDGKFDAGAGACAGSGLQAGLGTMFQDAVDWLSADRRLEYANWVDGIKLRMAIIEGAA